MFSGLMLGFIGVDDRIGAQGGNGLLASPAPSGEVKRCAYIAAYTSLDTLNRRNGGKSQNMSFDAKILDYERFPTETRTAFVLHHTGVSVLPRARPFL